MRRCPRYGQPTLYPQVAPRECRWKLAATTSTATLHVRRDNPTSTNDNTPSVTIRQDTCSLKCNACVGGADSGHVGNQNEGVGGKPVLGVTTKTEL